MIGEGRPERRAVCARSPHGPSPLRRSPWPRTPRRPSSPRAASPGPTGLGLTSTEAGLDRLRRADAADLAARACPDGPLDRVQLLSDLVTWLFAFDDRCDEDELGTDPGRLAPVLTPLLDMLDLLGAAPAEAAGAAQSAEPVGAAAQGLHDLCKRIRSLGRPTALLRFATSMRQYLVALLWEASNRQQQRVPRLTEYVQMRRHTGAVLPSFTLTDLGRRRLPGRGRPGPARGRPPRPARRRPRLLVQRRLLVRQGARARRPQPGRGDRRRHRLRGGRGAGRGRRAVQRGAGRRT